MTPMVDHLLAFIVKVDPEMPKTMSQSLSRIMADRTLQDLSTSGLTKTQIGQAIVNRDHNAAKRTVFVKRILDASSKGRRAVFLQAIKDGEEEGVSLEEIVVELALHKARRDIERVLAPIAASEPCPGCPVHGERADHSDPKPWQMN